MTIPPPTRVNDSVTICGVMQKIALPPFCEYPIPYITGKRVPIGFAGEPRCAYRIFATWSGALGCDTHIKMPLLGIANQATFHLSFPERN